MQNLRNNILLGLSLFYCATGLSSAATLVTFDKPNLVVVLDERGTYGYYAGFSIRHSAFSNTTVRHECKFMFMRWGGNRDILLRTLAHPIKDWSSAPYAEGSIRVDGNTWKIRFSDRPSGCESVSGQDDIIVPLAGPESNLKEYTARGAVFEVTKKTNVLGIRWVGFNTVVRRRLKEKFVATRKKLGVGTLVVALNRSGAYSEVEYLDLDSNKKSVGWVHSNKLLDPFPKN